MTVSIPTGAAARFQLPVLGRHAAQARAVARASYDYGWITNPAVSTLALDGCVTAITDLSVDEALVVFGADLTAPATRLDLGHDCPQDAAFNVAIGRTRNGIIAVERNGYQGARPEVLRELSKKGRALSVYWSQDVALQVAMADRGALRYAVDPTDPASLSDPRNEAFFRGLNGSQQPRTDPEWVAYGLQIMRRSTGLGISLDLLAHLGPTYRLAV